MNIKKIIIGISILIIISFIFIIINNLFLTSKENFKDKFNEPIKVIFKTKEEIQIFISNDKDDYIKNMSIYDLRARKAKTNDEYKNMIIVNCLDFTQEQKEKILVCCKKAIKFFNNGKDWKFGLISNIYEEGYPHTREDIIFLSPSILNYNEDMLTKTLIHESIHIYQRYNKNEIDNYIKKNGFEKIRRREKDGLIRSNPDLDEFIYKDKYGNEMIAYYNSENPNGIGDVKLSNLNMEHPFEYMAYEFADNYYKFLISKYKDI